jgi:hypothetical protein
MRYCKDAIKSGSSGDLPLVHRLFQVYGWEEKKTKASWGGTSVDHEKLAEGRIRAMTTADLSRLLVTCALVSDLYCPGYSSAEALSKEANLMRTAVRYKVDASRITDRITAELSTKTRGARETAAARSGRRQHQRGKVG